MNGQIRVFEGISQRILSVMPAGTYAMHRFLDLVDVVIDELSPTACMEAGPQPRLHLNAKFVEEHCQTNEHLFLLVMHELRHLILGHTTLYTTHTTPAHNIAFDAIINATLCHDFNSFEYTSFFQSLNGTDSTAGRLLRPPEGWSDQVHDCSWLNVRSPDIPGLYGHRMSRKERWILHRLYYAAPPRVTVQEIVDLLRSKQKSGSCGCAVLLGDHGASGDAESNSREGADAAALRDPVVRSVVRDMADQWSRNGKNAGMGAEAVDYLLPKARDVRREFLVALRRLMEKAGIFARDNGRIYKWKPETASFETRTVLPEWRDRHAAAREMLLDTPPVLYQSWTERKTLRWSPFGECHVYLDISASMFDDLPWLAAALNPLETSGRCRVYVFSTIVDTVRRGRLHKDEMKNTFGTDINCVLKHALSFPEAKAPQKMVVLTDGYTRFPKPELAAEFQKRKMDVYVGLVGEDASALYLQDKAKCVQHLPPLKGKP